MLFSHWRQIESRTTYKQAGGWSKGLAKFLKEETQYLMICISSRLQAVIDGKWFSSIKYILIHNDVMLLVQLLLSFSKCGMHYNAMQYSAPIHYLSLLILCGWVGWSLPQLTWVKGWVYPEQVTSSLSHMLKLLKNIYLSAFSTLHLLLKFLIVIHQTPMKGLYCISLTSTSWVWRSEKLILDCD